MYKLDIFQVYRTLKEFNCNGDKIPQGMLLQIFRYRGSTISVKSEEGKTYQLLAPDLLNSNNFKRIF